MPRKPDFESGLDKELRFHLNQAIEDHVAAGMSREDARRRALRDFGSMVLAKEEIRDTRPRRWLADFRQDFRYAAAGYRRNPGFALTAIVVLALGVGANVAVFTLMYRTLVAPLPVRNPDELVEISCVDRYDPAEVVCTTSYPAFESYRERRDVLSGAFAFSSMGSLNVTYEGTAGQGTGLLATADIYEVLGVTAAIGRLLDPSDDDPAAPPVAVLSYPYWQTRFGGDPGIVGKILTVDNSQATVVGVTPAGFRSVSLDITPDVTLPMGSMAPVFRGRRALEERANWWLSILGRLQPGVSVERVQAVLEPLYRRALDDTAAVMPGARDIIYARELRVRPASSGAVSEFRTDMDRPVRILMAVVGIVLLIACANLSGLILARAGARRLEFGMRLALGAGRARIVRQVLTESTLLAVLGGAGGLLVAFWTADVLVRMSAGSGGLRAIDTTPDATVLAFTGAISTLTAILIGLIPALRVSGADPREALGEERGMRTTFRVTRALIPAQVALAAVLTIGATLFLFTFRNYREVDLGFPADRLISFRASPGSAGYDAIRSRAYFDEVLDRLNDLSGVASAALSSDPVVGLANTTGVVVPGFEVAGFGEVEAGRYRVGPGFAATTGLELLRGRDLTEADNTGAIRGALVNESFARHYFGTIDVVGREFGFQSTFTSQPTYVVVAVVAAARHRGPKNPSGRVAYAAVGLEPLASAIVTVRSSGDARRLMPSVRDVVSNIAPEVPILEFQTVADIVDEQLRRESLLAALGTAFGVLSLLLVGVGLYGLVSGTVAARTRELGIRVSLGASPASVVRLVTRESASLVLAGGAVGLGAGMFLGRFVESQLFGVAPSDPFVYVFTAVTVVAVAALAAWLPARRATRLDPVLALRAE